MTRPFRRIALLVALIAISPWPGPSEAQALRDRILQDVEINDQCILVGFSFPIQYIRHFPSDSGDEIRIRIRPRLVGRINGNALSGRETVRPPNRQSLGLSEVTFEGDVVGGPYLLVQFDRQVNFKVSVGTDFRSLVILVDEKGAKAECFPE